MIIPLNNSTIQQINASTIQRFNKSTNQQIKKNITLVITMATNKNKIIKIKGTLNGLSFYTLNGKEVIRKAYGPSSQTINNNPAYKTVKNNNTEFALASSISKTIRTELSGSYKQFQDSYAAGRLTGVIRNIINNSKGEMGTRTPNFKNTPILLLGFPLSKNKPFSYYCLAKQNITFTQNKNTVKLNIPSIIKSSHHNISKTATHFKITLAIAIIKVNTNHSINQNQKSIKSPLLNINTSHNNLSLKLTIPENNKKATITTWLGIQYYNSQNNHTEAIYKANAMSCENIF